MIDYSHIFSDRAQAAKTSPIIELFQKTMHRSDIISFAAGAPDTSLLPVQILETLTKRASKKYGRMVLQYGQTQGFQPLREAVLPLLEKRGITCKSENVHISTGGSGALNNIYMALLNKGDTVLVESPTYTWEVNAFSAYEANVLEVASDAEGILPAALEQKLKRHKVKFIYLLPTFQNPTGRTFSRKRRQHIASLAKKYNTLMIEDDVYYDLRYTGSNIPALYTFAPEYTIYCTSLSKIFAPAVRVGIALMPSPILEKVLILKQGIDMQTSSYMQALATEFLISTYAQSHLNRIKRVYGQKLEIMLKALHAYMPKGFVWNKPEGGMFLWVEGSKNFDANALLPQAIDAGVVFLPGSSFYVNEKQGRNSLRLSFANPPKDKIEEGIKILAGLVG